MIGTETSAPGAVVTPAEDAILSCGRVLPQRPLPPARFSETLAAVAAVGERFDLDATWTGPLDERILASELTDAQIERAVAARGAGLRTSEEKIAANMWLQWYAYRMAAPLLAAWMLHRRIPDVSASNIAFRFDGEGRPVYIAMVEPRCAGLPGDHVDDLELSHVSDLLPEIVRVLLDQHLLPLMERVRARYRFGAPISKGTIASQIGMALTFVDAHSAVPWEQIATDAICFFDLTRPIIDGQGRSGDIICTEIPGRVGMTFRRGTCCLVYRAPDRQMCGGCPLRSDQERAEVWAQRLAARPETSFV